MDRNGAVQPADALQSRFFFNASACPGNAVWDYDQNGTVQPADALQVRFFFNNNLTGVNCP